MPRQRSHFTSGAQENLPPQHATRIRHQVRSDSQISIKGTNGEGSNTVKKYLRSAVHSDGFLTDNWNGEQTIHNFKAALKLSEAAPNLNKKALEMLGVSETKHKSKSSKDTDHEQCTQIVFRNDVGSQKPKHYLMKQAMQSYSDPSSYKHNLTMDRTSSPRQHTQNDVPQNARFPAPLFTRSQSVKSADEADDNKLAPLALDDTETHSEPFPLWNVQCHGQRPKADGAESPSAHLLCEDDVDFMQKKESNVTLTHSQSLKVTMANRLMEGSKNLMKRMSLRQSVVDGLSKEIEENAEIEQKEQTYERENGGKYVEPALRFDTVGSYIEAGVQLNGILEDIETNTMQADNIESAAD